MNLRQPHALSGRLRKRASGQAPSTWLWAVVALVPLVALLVTVGGASAAPDTDLFDPDVRLSDNFFPPNMSNQLIVASSCAPNSDLAASSTITVAQRSSGVALIPGAPNGGWVFGNLTWQLQATIGAQTLDPVDEFWPFTIDGAPTGSHGLATGSLTAFQGQFAIDRAPFGSNAGEDIAGTMSLGSDDGNWGVCRTFSNEQTESPLLGGFVTGAVHTLHAGVLTYTVTQGPAGLLGETGDAAATLMNSYATDAVNTTQVRIATGHFRQEFGTTIPSGGSESTGAGAAVAPVTVEPLPDVTITFSDVSADGFTNVVQTTDAPALPGGFQLVGEGLFYEIKTSATIVPPITVCFPTAGLPVGATPEILHFEPTPAPGAWVQVPTTVDGDQACGEVNSLSPFALGFSEVAPEAMIEDVVEDIRALTTTRNRDKLEDAVGKLEAALDKLAQSPPDRQGAVGELEGAVGDVQAASRRLASGEADSLMRQIAEAARLVAETAIDDADGGDDAKLDEAEAALAAGDARLASGRYKDAVAKYKDAVSKAEGA